MDKDARDFYIATYHNDYGMTHREIALTLLDIHGYYISERHIRRVLSSNNLRRHGPYSQIDDVFNFIQELLYGSSSYLGYRFLYHKCRAAGFLIPQEAVRLILQLLDPEGVAFRISRRLLRRRYYANGPNYIWHLDGYDKLVPFGIGISACVDGFSRYVIWAEAYKTNKNPRIVAGYYFQSVSELNACPNILRVDAGTENVTCLRLQQLFRENNGIVPDQCTIVGASTANQRIESWWAMYRRGNAEFWISLFHNLQSSGQFIGDDLDKELVRFFFLGIVQVR